MRVKRSAMALGLLGLAVVLAVLGRASLRPAGSLWDDGRPEVEEFIGDFRKIPGVTDAEIAAIEGLGKRSISFGTQYSGEAFAAKDGQKGGFLINLAAALSGMLGLDIRHEFMPRGELEEALADGRLDLACEVRLDQGGVLTHTESPIFKRQIMVFRRKGDGPVNSYFPLQDSGLRYGFLHDSAVRGLVVGSTVQKVESVVFRDNESAVEALEEGRIDAFFDEAPAIVFFKPHNGIEGQSYFPPINTSQFLATADPSLAPVISVVQKFLNAGGTEYLFGLYDRSRVENRRTFFEDDLDQEQRIFLDHLRLSKKPIKASIKSANYPESFYNHRSERFEGVALDVMDRLESILGVGFEIISQPGDDEEKARDLLRTDQADVLASVNYFEEDSSDVIMGSKALSYDRYALISLQEEPDLQLSQIAYVRVGLVSGLQYSRVYWMWFPEARNVTTFGTMEEALQALRKDKVDYVMASRNFLLNLTNFQEEPGFKLALVFEEDVPSGFCYVSGDYMLRSLLDEAMTYIDLKQIQAQWNSRMFDYHSKFVKDIMPLLCLFSFLLLVGILALMRMNVNNRRLNRNLGQLVDERTRELLATQVELVSEKQFLSKILDSCPVSLIITRDDEIIFINPFARSFFGKSVGDGWSDCFLDKEADREYLDVISRGGEVNWKPVSLIKANGEICEALLNCFLGDYLGHRSYMNWLTDVTELRRNATELALARELAEKNSKAKSELLANMSHEIRTPMNAILGLTQLTLQTAVSDVQRDYLEKTIDATTSLLGIINDILDFSKIEAGKISMEAIPFRLDRMLDKTINLFVFKAREKGIELIVYVDPKTPAFIIGDPLRLGQVINNLLGNAMKFTEKGSVRLEIGTQAKNKDKITLRFRVIDTGIGLSEEQRGKLFSAFSQADSSFTRRYGGTGLGLSISKGLVELMNGQIWVMGELGRGCEFGFTAVFGWDGDEVCGQEVAALRETRALAVDDYRPALDVLSRYLGELGLRVREAWSGEEALGLLAGEDREEFDLAIIDSGGPGLDGLAVARAVAGEGFIGKRPKVILAVNGDGGEFQDGARLAGVDKVLPKPLTQRSLAEALAEVLGLQGARGATRAREKRGQEEMAQVAHLKGARILLAEDNEINQLVATRLLKNAGLEVDVAQNGQQALTMVQDGGYDLVLMDIQMPEMDGITAAKAIRELPGLEGLPIVAMTAHAMIGDREESLAAGMNDHITKPIDLRELFKALGRWIRAPGAGMAG
ncbi:MAG: response regulator [Deltaproteobacteria bacterium]|nr:response regulator [Deltaproteobacteria bacterium]